MTGRSPSGRACAPSGLSRDASQAEPLVPNAPFRISVRWGHLDHMARCAHGRVICSECGL